MTILFELIARYHQPAHIARVVALVSLFIGTPFVAEAHAQPGCPPFIRISYGDLITERDGSLTLRLFIRTPHASSVLPDGGTNLKLNAFYETECLSSEGPRHYYRTSVKCNNGVPYVDINSGVSSRIELTVSGTCGNRQYRAQTVFCLFGISGMETANSMSPLGHLEVEKPFIHLIPDPSHRWMQTGETYRFAYKKGGNGSRVADVFENERHLETLDVDPAGRFIYKPPHDRNLDRAGRSAHKEVVLLIKEQAFTGTAVTVRNHDGAGYIRESTGKDEYASTFTLLLHRSYYGHRKLLPGIALFLLTATVTALAVIQKRRAFPW